MENKHPLNTSILNNK